MFHQIRYFLLVTFLLMLCIGTPARSAEVVTLPTVAQVDLNRYAGQWYEISRLPMWFERHCVGDITATYTLRADDHIDVLNRCRTQSGFISARGIAEVPDPAQPGQLRVRFAPDWLAWLPVVWGDYWIIELDTDYRWVMIGAPSRGYLWILSRSPSLDPSTIAYLKLKAANLGFAVDPMIDVLNSAD